MVQKSNFIKKYTQKRLLFIFFIYTCLCYQQSWFRRRWGLSLFFVTKPVHKTKSEYQVVQALFDGHEIEKQEHGSQFNFSTRERLGG